MKYNDVRAFAERHHIHLIYLFGSQADVGKRYLEGQNIMPDAYSDLDVAVVIDVSSNEAVETYGILYRELSRIFDPFAVDLILMHEVNPLLQYEIIKGERIYERDESYADDFEERIMKIAEDLSYKKRIFNNEIMEAMENGYFEFEYRPNP
jgi:predicted nucleotidyltransferase